MINTPAAPKRPLVTEMHAH